PRVKADTVIRRVPASWGETAPGRPLRPTPFVSVPRPPHPIKTGAVTPPPGITPPAGAGRSRSRRPGRRPPRRRPPKAVAAKPFQGGDVRMDLLGFLSSVLARMRSARQSRPAAGPRPRLSLEALENRLLPTCTTISGFVYFDANDNGL